MDAKELAKQLSKYADTITAFTVVQGVGFCLLVAQSDRVDRVIFCRWYILAFVSALATLCYMLLVHRCHWAEDELLESAEKRAGKIASVVIGIRKARMWVIFLMGLGEVALSIGMKFFAIPANCL